MPRTIPRPRGNYNARLGKGLTKLDPTRTGRLRRMFSLEIRRRFSRLFAETRRLAQLTTNLASTQFNLEQQDLLDAVRHIQSLLDPRDVVELETQSHITVRYGLHDQEAEAVQSLYRNQLPIRVKLKGLSLFPAGEASSLRGGPQYDVLKIDVESRGLTALHSRLGLLPNTSTHPVYHPHLTIAYLKPGTGIKYVGESGLEGTELTFARLVFSNDKREHTILENAFCPTGKGGGQDNSCPPTGGVGSTSFKKWFKGSKVVKEDGSPKVVYHGTTASVDFAEFKTPGPESYPTLDQMLGMHFAEDPKVSETFASKYGGDNGRILPLHLSIQNPREVGQRTLPNGELEHDAYAIQRDIRETVLPDRPDLFVSWITKSRMVNEEQGLEIFKRLKNGESIGHDEYNGVVGHDVEKHPGEHPVSGYFANYDSGLLGFSYAQKQEIVQEYKSKLKEQGFDGIKYTNTAPGEIEKASDRDTWIAFYPSQIKSALGNRGTYDPASGDIRNARTKDQHVNRFMKDFNSKVKTTLNDKPWWEEYINAGFQTGVGRAYDDVKKPLLRPADQRKEYTSGKREFLKSTVKGSQDTVKRLYKEVQKDLDRITFQLGKKLNDYLEEAVAEGKTLRQAVSEILPKLEAEGLRRAENVAQYRTVEAHSEGQLAAFEELGVEDLGVLVEWTTAATPCPMCAEMAGVVLTPKDARGLIPRHPHCKCAWEVIDSDDIDEDEHIIDRSGIRRAIKASLKQGGRKGAKLDELLDDEWGGVDAEFEGRPLFNIGITPELLQFSEFASNVFCPTGKGGGVDPTCSPSSTTKGGEDLYSASRGEDKVWRMANGEPAPEHIQKLAIPPAWKQVEINPNPKGTVYARGVDAKGRVQTRYSATKTAQQAAAKFGRTRELIKKREQIYKEIDRDAKHPELKEEAECLKLVMQTGMRPGSDKDTKADHKSYGATTLEGRHVIANKDGTVTLRLVTGKNKGREVDFPVVDKSTASMLKTRAKESGKDGRLFRTSAANLRDYSKTKDGGGFKTKDHRTALGTETALRAIKTMTTPTTMKDYKAQVKEVATKVSQTLGNTPSIALKSYIDPQVFSAWNKGLK